MNIKSFFLYTIGCLLMGTMYAQRPIDYSFAGYNASLCSLPQTGSQVSITLHPISGDNSMMIQAAIDELALQPLNAEGYRGVIELSEGTFRSYRPLIIRASGIVIKGSGQGTELVMCSTDRAPFIQISGNQSSFHALASITEDATAGSCILKLDDVSCLKEGQNVSIIRPSTKEWIEDIKANQETGHFADIRVHWIPGHRDVVWDRTIKTISLEDKTVTLDAPITLPMELHYGGGQIGTSVVAPVKEIGLKDMTLVSGVHFAHPADEEHSWIGVWTDYAENIWIKNLKFKHFCGSAVRVGPHARMITIDQCSSSEPVSEKIGYRNQAFYIEGQQVLVKNCTVTDGQNDFVVGLCAAGPNVFLNCVSEKPIDDSGSWEGLSAGTLFENLDLGGGGLYLTYDTVRTQGACWTGMNTTIWNCKHGELKTEGTEWAPNEIKTSKQPLYAQLLKKRVPKAQTKRIGKVAKLSDEAIRQKSAILTIKKIPSKKEIDLVNGRFVQNNHTVWGGSVNDAWWMGRLYPGTACTAGVSITRFMPGRFGHGLTENISELTDSMLIFGNHYYESGPGLWYDRRRDDHTYESRNDGYVWAPFYELPWARTGIGKAWDGASLYDLRTFNPWYFSRIRDLAQQCDKKGIMLFHSLFNTHNVLEIAPHWCDYPARPVNSVNSTALPEPMPVEPKGRLHVGNQYYSVADTALMNLDKLYINKVLDELGDYSNICFCVAFQYSGTLEFLKFFHQTVADWEIKHGTQVKLLLRTSKEFTDSILQIPEYAQQVAAIDTRYWQYRPDSTLFAPQAGKNLAYREMIGQAFKGYGGPMPPTTPIQVYRQIREYTDRYPDKAIIGWKNTDNIIPLVMAGVAQVLYRNPTAGHGQLLQIGNPFDPFFEKYLAAIYYQMRPIDGYLQQPQKNWAMTTSNRLSWLLYSMESANLIPLFSGNFHALWYKPDTGEIRHSNLTISAGSEIQKPDENNWLLLLTQ